MRNWDHRSTQPSGILVVVMNHPEALPNGQGLSDFGASQAFAAGRALKKMGNFDCIIHNGEEAASQAARVIAIPLGFWKDVEISLDFNKEETLQVAYGDKRGNFLDQAHAIRREGGSIETALRISEYARFARDAATQAIVTLATSMAACQQRLALVVGSGPWAECAIDYPSTHEISYNLPEATGIMFKVVDGKIYRSTYLPPPVPSRSH